MDKLIEDFLWDKFNCNDKETVTELMLLINYIPDDVYNTGYSDGYSDGVNSQQNR